jgi:hypothetical protein
MFCVWGRKGISRVLLGKPKVRDHLEDLGIDGRIIFKWIFRKWDGGMCKIDLAPDRYSWLAVVSAVMNIQVPQMQGLS